MDLFFYHLTFATRAQASAYAAQERARFPADAYETDLTVAPRTDRPVREGTQDAPGGAHQWAVDGSRLLAPKAR